jgi:hypothetical protein
VLKEDGKTAQSQKWMWVTRGGPPDKPSVLFAYDPSRAGEVAGRLLDGFTGGLQIDGYSGYAAVCAQQGIRRIGCWDHARRKFVEASRAGSVGKKKGKAKGRVAKADVALGHIRELYAIERKIADRSPEERHRARQALSVPKLEALKAWLFADTTRGAHASATMYSLIETAKANDLEPRAYLLHVLERIGAAETLDAVEALMPWNVDLPRFEKKFCVRCPAGPGGRGWRESPAGRR